MIDDLSTDELRRRLRDVDRAQRAALGPWRRALRRAFGGDGGISAEAKAQLLGVPSPGRRQLFALGGATVLGAAVLAACGDDGGSSTSTTGAAGATTTAGAPDGGLDLTLLRTATSLELLAVETYTTAAGSGLVTTPAVADAAVLFRDQHQEHAEQLQGATEAAGGTRYEEVNAYLKTNVVEPALAGLRSETDVVAFAAALESSAAQTYGFAAGALSTPELRQAIMAIGGVEARHYAILRGVLGEPQVPAAFQPDTDRIPDEALVM